jgi:serine/threonine protein phosphatase PrpC
VSFRRNVVALSDSGLVRGRNEDAIAIDGKHVKDGELTAMVLSPPGPHNLVLADGLGGHARGDAASSLVARYLSEAKLDSPEACLEAIRSVNWTIYDEMQRDKSLSGMGSTVAGAVLLDDQICWFNVGDSRIYLFRSNELRQLSIDHVPLEDTTKRVGRSHIITQSLGGGHFASEVWPAVGRFEFYKDDILLLCSDGLTDVVDDTTIANVLARHLATSVTVRGLVDLALQEGGPDNVSVLIVGPIIKLPNSTKAASVVRGRTPVASVT